MKTETYEQYLDVLVRGVYELPEAQQEEALHAAEEALKAKMAKDPQFGPWLKERLEKEVAFDERTAAQSTDFLDRRRIRQMVELKRAGRLGDRKRAFIDGGTDVPPPGFKR